VSNTKEMRIKVVEISGDVTARVAAPWIRLGVEATVQEVQRLVRVDDVAVGTGETATCRRR